MQSIKDIIESISLKNLQNFVIEYAENNERFARSITTRFTSVDDKSQVAELKRKFNSIIEYNSRHGFIEWRDAGNFEKEMGDFLDSLNSNTSFIENDSSKDALTHFSKRFGNLPIDDSNGCMSYLCHILKDLWDNCLSLASVSMQSELRKWIEDHLYQEDMWMMDDFLEEVYSENFNDDKDFDAKIKFYDRLIKKGLESKDPYHPGEIRIEHWVGNRADVMQRKHCDSVEIEAYLKKFATMSDAAFALFDLYKESRRYDEAEDVFLNLLKEKSNYAGIQKIVRTKLKDLYQGTNQRDKYLEILKNITRQENSLESFKEFKTAIPKAKWKQERETFLRDVFDPHFKMLIYKSENMVDELYAAFMRIAALDLSYYLFRDFGKKLCPKYEDDVVKEFYKYLDNEMKNANNRNEYNRIVGEAKTLLTYKGGREAVMNLKEVWAVRHKNRPAMLEELKRI